LAVDQVRPAHRPGVRRDRSVVKVAGARQRFSFLMVKTSTGWACAQFL